MNRLNSKSRSDTLGVKTVMVSMVYLVVMVVIVTTISGISDRSAEIGGRGEGV